MGVPHESVQALYVELGPALLAYARSIVPSRAEAEDALQQVFVKLMAPHAALPREPRPYLFRAIRNTCLNRRRSASRHTAPPRDVMFEAPDGRGDLALDLQAALGELPDEQREVVMLRIWGEMTIEEAAQVLEIPANTAGSRYRYALAKLRARFGAAIAR
jgi:RNA polymerase sigma factor (sigma-70 family)